LGFGASETLITIKKPKRSSGIAPFCYKPVPPRGANGLLKEMV